MSWQDANERQRNRGHDHQRCLERLEPPDHQYVNEHQDSRESHTKVTKYLDRDVPLTVPFHRESVSALWQGRAGVLLHVIAVGQLDFVDRIAHLKDGVHRTFYLPCYVPRDVHHGPQVLAVNALINHGVPDAGDLAKRNLSA